MSTPAVSGVHLDVATGRWELVVGSEVWGDYDTEEAALAAKADFDDDQHRQATACPECCGTGTDPLSDLRACRACGGCGRQCPGSEVAAS